MAAKKKTRHGATQPEDERTAKAVLLRLLPKTRRELDAMAKRWGLTRSQAVTELVERANPDR
jgi:predicted DNA-binding protein